MGIMYEILSPGGLSPLTRGKLCLWSARAFQPGTIPAHAGKTSRAASRQKSARDYPRSRGENLGLEMPQTAGQGLSPLTRGKRGGIREHAGRRGTIPAHAGKTLSSSGRTDTQRDYPRSRGENAPIFPHLSRRRGLSPLTRGKLIVARWLGWPAGTIPAHAGKTCSAGTAAIRKWDYPRSRGENYRRPLISARHRGLSPLTRGKLRRM